MRRPIGVVAIAVALLVAACGGGSGDVGIASLEGLAASPASGDTTTTTQVSGEDAMLAFAQCMRDQGIDMPDPTVDENGNMRMPRPNGAGQGEGTFDREAMMAAREACSQYLDGVAQRFEQVDQTAMQDQLLAYAACMRENGFDMPDPDFSAESGDGPGGGFFRSLDIDRSDPVFQAANDACRAAFGGGFFPGGGPGGFDGGPGGSPPARPDDNGGGN